MFPMALCDVAKSRFDNKMFPVGIDFGETGDVYFVTADVIAGILQSLPSWRHFEVVDILKKYTKMMIGFHCFNVISKG